MSYEHPTLGAFRYSEGDGGWLGRHDQDKGFSDLIVLVGDCDEEPSAAALDALMCAVRDLAALKAEALAHVRRFRRESVKINEGPADERWSVESIFADQAGVLRLDLYEGDTDEYSKWRVCFADGGVSVSREQA